MLANISLWSQANWTVNPNEYDKNMSVSGALNLDYEELEDDNDKIAAFINGEVRGVANLNYSSSVDRHIFFLTIFSNDLEGEITFKIYDASKNEVRDIAITMGFEVNQIIGDADFPLIISDPVLSNESKLISYSIDNQVTSKIVDTFVYLTFPEGTDLSSIKPNFEVSPYATVRVNGNDQESGVTVLDLRDTVTYWVRAADETTITNYHVVTEVLAAPVFKDTTFTINESHKVNTLIGNLMATDANTADTLVFTIQDVQSNFKIENNNRLVLNAAMDYETETSFQLTVNVSDGVHNDSKTVTINITDSNDNKPFLQGNQGDIPEDAALGTNIMTISTIDNDVSAEFRTFKYKIDTAQGNVPFLLDSITGVLTLNGKIDFEDTINHKVSVTVTDGIFYDTLDYIVDIVDVNDNSPILQENRDEIAEDAALGTNIMTISATDADISEEFRIFSYKINTTQGNVPFLLNSTTGILTLKDAIDFESDTSHTVSIVVTDGVFYDTLNYTIDVIDTNDETPMFNDTVFTINEGFEVDSIVGKLIATDLDRNTQFGFSVNNTSSEQELFNLSNDGILSLSNLLDYESEDTHILDILITDGNATVSGKITINISDENDNAPVLIPQIDSIAEDVNIGSIVMNIQATDADISSAFKIINYSVLASDSLLPFAVDSTTGNISTNDTLDFEETPNYSLNIIASDGKFYDTLAYAINIIDVNDEIPIINNGTINVEPDQDTIPEGISIGETVLSVVASDSDINEGFRDLQYSFLKGNTNRNFDIDSESGVITVAKEIDFETIESYQLVVMVTDGIFADTASINIEIEDLNDEIPTFSDTTFTISELFDIDSTVGNLIANDLDVGSNLVFEITDISTDNSLFEITESGTLSVSNQLNYEKYQSLIIDLSISDGINIITGKVNINIVDENDNAPTLASDEVIFAEDLGLNEEISVFTGIDLDISSEFKELTYRIINGNTNNDFAIDAQTGVVTNTDSLDFERTESYTLTIEVTDGLNSNMATLDIEVIDLNDELPIANDTVISLTEYTYPEASILQFMATDADAGTQLTYEVNKNYVGREFILSSTGELTLVGILDYETKNKFVIPIIISDEDFSIERTITINIVDEEETNVEVNSILSPNGDGTNDTWVLENNEAYYNCEFLIFDSFNRQVYKNIGYNNDWVGTYRSRELPSGAYYYMIIGKGFTHTGTISLIR